MSRSGFRGRRTAELNEISVLRPRIGPGFFKGRNGILRKKITEGPSIAGWMPEPIPAVLFFCEKSLKMICIPSKMKP